MEKYFHEIPQEEIETLISEGKNWDYIINNYNQPRWCAYPNALHGVMGCWCLVDLKKDGHRKKVSKDFCKECECYFS
jgi:hypothetical protein